VHITDGRSRVRPRSRATYRVVVRNTTRTPARGVRLTVDLSKALAVVRAGGATRRARRLTLRIGTLRAGATRTLRLAVRVRRGRRVALVRARVTAAEDALRRDDRASDRNLISARRAARSRRPARASVAFSRPFARYGWACRLP
jgi:hypothetical protein